MCPRGHPLTRPDDRFCGYCGLATRPASTTTGGRHGRHGRHGAREPEPVSGIEAPTVDLRATTRRSGVTFPGRPAFLGARNWPRWVSVAVVLGVLVASTLLGLVVTYPRAFYWVPVVLVVCVALAKAERFTVGLVGAMTAVVLIAWFIGQIVSTAWLAALGYDTSLRSTPVAAVVAAVGVVPLAAALCCLVDEHARDATVRWSTPRGAVDVVRVGVVVLAAVTALFPIGRSFTTGSGFAVVVAARDQVLFPGYASPGRVADGMRADFLAAGAPVTSVTCSYFAPNLGAPPVYNCVALLTVAGRVQYHDDIQSTGRPDGTFSCSDLTEGVSARLC